MGLLDVVKSAFGVGKPKNMMTLRPTELDSWTRGSADIAKMPIIPFVGYRFVSEIYMYSDLLKTIIRSLVQETFRKGITIVPRFVVKCNICGSDYDAKVEKCEVCGSDSLRPPNYFEREYLEKWLNDVNFNDQSLIEVLQDVDTDLNIYDNAYLAVVKRYFYNDKGEVVGSEVVEVLRANPEYVMLVIDREGRPARTDDGKVAMFCLEHRDRYVTLLPEQVEDARCTVCGRKLYPAYYTVRKWSQGGTVCYTNGEILHIKKFTHGLGYGVSPIFSVWMKVLTLIKMDFFILTAYHLERPPKGVLVLRGQMESIQKAWHRLQEEARNNPHMIYPFVVEGADKAPRIAEWIDLSFSAKDIEFIQYREEIRRTVGCYDAETEILTRDGWKRFSDLTDRDYVWQVNDDLSISLVKPKIIVADYDGRMIRYKSKSLDLFVTPNHNMVFVPEQKFFGGKFEPQNIEIRQADEFRRGVILQAIPNWRGERIDKFVLPGFDSKHYKAKDVVIDGDVFCAFMGLWLAEGSVSKWRRHSKVLIAQSDKSRYYQDIVELLNKMPFKWYRSGKNFIINSKQLYDYLVQFGHAGDKFVPDIIKNATKEQIRIFLDWFIKGDGSRRKYVNPVGVERIKSKSGIPLLGRGMGHYSGKIYCVDAYFPRRYECWGWVGE
jgi:hypothetical protein